MRLNRKFVTRGAAVILAGVCACACVGLARHNQQKASENDTAYVDEQPAGDENTLTPNDMSNYISDTDGFLSDNTKEQIDLYNANWKNAYNQVVAVAVSDTEMAAGDLTALKDQLGLTDRDSVIVVQSDTEGTVFFGENSPLLTSKIDTKISSTDDTNLQSAILAKLAKMQNYLNTFVETPDSGERKTLAEWEQLGTQIFENYQNTVSAYGLLAADVSGYNQEIYPGASVWQASSGGITTFCISGSRDDAESFWQFYYDKLINGAANGKFTQKYVPSDLNQPRSVYGYMEKGEESSSKEDPIIYYRADIVGNVCVTASATDESQIETITQFFNAIGVPENDNIVY